MVLVLGLFHILTLLLLEIHFLTKNTSKVIIYFMFTEQVWNNFLTHFVSFDYVDSKTGKMQAIPYKIEFGLGPKCITLLGWQSGNMSPMIYLLDVTLIRRYEVVLGRIVTPK